MRNDARPIGEGARHRSPIGSEQRESRDDSVTHAQDSQIVNREAEEPKRSERDDPLMPSNQSSVKTKI